MIWVGTPEEISGSIPEIFLIESLEELFEEIRIAYRICGGTSEGIIELYINPAEIKKKILEDFLNYHWNKIVWRIPEDLAGAIVDPLKGVLGNNPKNDWSNNT